MPSTVGRRRVSTRGGFPPSRSCRWMWSRSSRSRSVICSVAARGVQGTATTITSAGNRKPASADSGGSEGRGREYSVIGQACRDPSIDQRNGAGRRHLNSHDRLGPPVRGHGTYAGSGSNRWAPLTRLSSSPGQGIYGPVSSVRSVAWINSAGNGSAARSMEARSRLRPRSLSTSFVEMSLTDRRRVGPPIARLRAVGNHSP